MGDSHCDEGATEATGGMADGAKGDKGGHSWKRKNCRRRRNVTIARQTNHRQTRKDRATQRMNARRLKEQFSRSQKSPVVEHFQSFELNLLVDSNKIFIGRNLQDINVF